MNRERLIVLIQQAGISKKHLAKELGISTQSLYNKLQGRSEWRLSEMETLCRVLQISELAEREDIFFNN